MKPHLIVPSASVNSPIEYSASDKAAYLMRDGRHLAELFARSADLKQDARAIAKADLLKATYRPGNVFYASDLQVRETGDLFDGYGVLVNLLASRISKAYLTASARRQRKRIKATLAQAKIYVGERYRFLTLTMPYLQADCVTVLAIKDRAFELFRKRAVWHTNVRASFVAEEMTIGSSSTFHYIHYHVHAHALLLGKYIEHSLIANKWTDCVEIACREFGVEFLMTNLESNRLTVHIEDVATRSAKEGKTLEESVDELCKYVVKGSDFAKVPLDKLTEIETALHNRKMIKSYGDFNNQKGKGKRENADDAPSLDTKCTTDGFAFQRPKRPSRASLVERGVKLILDGRRGEWLKMLGVEMATRREFRVEQLAWKFPFATFRTLDGKRWFGVSERPPQVVVSLSDYKARRARTENHSTSGGEAFSPYQPLPVGAGST